MVINRPEIRYRIPAVKMAWIRPHHSQWYFSHKARETTNYKALSYPHHDAEVTLERAKPAPQVMI